MVSRGTPGGGFRGGNMKGTETDLTRHAPPQGGRGGSKTLRDTAAHLMYRLLGMVLIPISYRKTIGQFRIFQGLTAGAADPDVRVEILIAARIPPALTLRRATCVMVRGSKAGGAWL